MKLSPHLKQHFEYPFRILLFIITLGSGILDYFTPAMGDDLIFWNDLGLEEYQYPNRKTLSFIAAHIFGCNGRLLDYIGPILINLLPRIAAAAIMGLMSSMFFLSLLLVAGISCKDWKSAAIVSTLALLLLPWWDALWLRVCQFNYLWSTTFCLLSIYFFFKNSGNKYLLFFLGLLSSASHEQAAVSMCGALILYYIAFRRKHSITPQQKSLTIGLFLGALISLGAPSIWMRAASAQAESEPEFTNLIFTTFPILFALIATLFIMQFSRRGRLFFSKLITGKFLLLLCAAVLSETIGLLSGIPGRTGFFAEACAIACFILIYKASGITLNKILKSSLAILSICFICVHYTVSAAEQSTLYSQYQHVVDSYKNSSDGIVHFDFTNRFDVSPLTLYRVKGVPDADDLWNLHALQVAYKPEGPEPTIIPSNATIYHIQPSPIITMPDGLTFMKGTDSSILVLRHAVTSDGDEIWVATERVQDPGDYDLSF